LISPEDVQLHYGKAVVAALAAGIVLCGCPKTQTDADTASKATANMPASSAIELKGKKKPDDVMVYIMVSGRRGFVGMAGQSKHPGREKVIYIDIRAIELEADAICDDWKMIVENRKRFTEGDPRWDPAMQGIYSAIASAGVPEVRNAFIKERFEGTMAHECKHIADIGRSFSPVDKETRAIMAELMTTPLVLHDLEISQTNKSSERIIMRAVAGRVLNGLLSFGDVLTKRDLYKLSRQEIARRAQALYVRWYRTLEPPAEWCTKRARYARK